MASVMAVKLWRDLRALRGRLALMVFAVAVSLTVFGGVLIAWGITSRETADAYRHTEPASATLLFTRGVAVGRMAAIAMQFRQRPGILAATGRTQFNGEILVDGERSSVPLQAFVAAPGDSMRMARFAVVEGRWPPPPGEIFIGRDSLELLHVAIGATVTVRTPMGASARLRVGGVVYDPSLAPAPQHQTGHAYLSTETLVSLGEPALLDQLKIQVADPGKGVPSRSRDAIIAAASEIGRWLQRDCGVALREIQVPEPYAHPHQRLADALLLSLVAGGAAAFLLSGILVANLLNGVFAQQIPQIGIMKAIGARSGHIGRLYLLLTFVVAAAATLLAAGPAALMGHALATTVLGFLGVMPASLNAPGWIYGVIGAVGLGVPLVMAVGPLVRASRITVRAAIDHRGAVWAPGALLAGLSRLGPNSRVDRSLLMALRNTVRRPARALLAVGMLAGAGAVFIAGLSLGSEVAAIADEARAQRRWDVEVQLVRPAQLTALTGRVARLPHVLRVEGWSTSMAGVSGPGEIPLTGTYPDQGHGGVVLTGVPSGETTFTLPRLSQGRWLRPGECGAIVLNQVIRTRIVPGVAIGDSVQLFVGGKPGTWRVVGFVEEARGGAGGAYVTQEGFGKATGRPGQVNVLRLVTDRHEESVRASVAGAARSALDDAHLAVASASSVSRAEAVDQGHLHPIIAVVLAIAIALGVLGGVGLAATMSANVLERTREFGIMHALGARPEAVRRIVVVEGVFLALASCVLAIVPALVTTALLGAGLGHLFMSTALPLRISVLAAGIWLVLVVFIAAYASEAPALRASRTSVREALAYI